MSKRSVLSAFLISLVLLPDYKLQVRALISLMFSKEASEYNVVLHVTQTTPESAFSRKTIKKKMKKEKLLCAYTVLNTSWHTRNYITTLTCGQQESY